MHGARRGRALVWPCHHHHRGGGRARRAGAVRGSNCLFRGSFPPSRLRSGLRGRGGRTGSSRSACLSAAGKQDDFDPTVTIIHNVARVTMATPCIAASSTMRAPATSALIQRDLLSRLKHSSGLVRWTIRSGRCLVGSHVCPDFAPRHRFHHEAPTRTAARFCHAGPGRAAAFKPASRSRRASQPLDPAFPPRYGSPSCSNTFARDRRFSAVRGCAPG